MSNHTTGAQRYNNRMDKIFAKSEELNKKYHGEDHFGSSKKEVESKKKSVAKKMKKSWATEWHGKHAGGGDKFSSGFGGRDNS
jgi:hypothetical protein